MTSSTACSGCGRDNPPGAAYCADCGTAVGSSPPGAPSSASPPPSPPSLAKSTWQQAASPNPGAGRPDPHRRPAARAAASGASAKSTWQQAGGTGGGGLKPLWQKSAATTSPADRRATGPRWGDSKDLTRYLCAASYLDRAFARALIKEIAAEPHLGVAAAPACDLNVVLRHAYLADARRHSRDLVLAGLLLFALVAARPVVILLVLFLAWMTALVFELSTRYGRFLQNLRPDRFDPQTAPQPVNPSVAARLGQIDGYATGNVTTYSGYAPFLGYGSELDSWSLSFDVTTSSRPGANPQNFDVKDLYDHIANRVGTLAVSCLEIEERVFVDGLAVLENKRFLPNPLGRPVARVSPRLMDDLKRNPEEGARPYLIVHSTGWRGELVTSLFLRFFRSETNLSVEAVQTVLGPLHDRYRLIDTLMPRPTAAELVNLISQTMVRAPFLLVPSLFRAVVGFFPDYGMRWRVRHQDKLITRLRRFDYGARQSVRQKASAGQYRRYFQKADNGMVLKTVEKRVLDALVEFAEARDIDVSELIQRQEVIINNGIIATEGAKVESNAVASGEKSRISIDMLKKTFSMVTD
ncbi:zinc ribbon domain-containing protein [Streptomyces sp. NPDC090442]|uniref:zinc ribbon domain-containing protein n=1 Tax=Streptomyces sp. NPDC090442 TaxID=3365962 RepID=UPI00380BBEE2